MFAGVIESGWVGAGGEDRAVPDYKLIKLPPDAANVLKTTTDWLKWADSEGLLPSVAPRPDDACRLCCGSAVRDQSGHLYPRCYHCNGYSGIFTAVIPLVYSLPSGFESVLHKYKDWDGYEWLKGLLASLLWEFLARHLACLTQTFGSFDVATVVPSMNKDRTWDPFAKVLGLMHNWPVAWDQTLLTANSVDRPKRGEVHPEVFKADAGAVNGMTVLLLDDTWTTGASAASAARCLRLAGAKSVVLVTFGRQLKPGYGTADELIELAETRTYQGSKCVICG